MTDRTVTLTGKLSLIDNGEGHDALCCGGIVVAEWAEEEIGAGSSVHGNVWTENYGMSAKEAERRTREAPNRWVSVRYWIADHEESNGVIKRRAIEQLYGAVEIEWGSHYSEITGYLWTDEDFKVGGHDMIARLTSEVGHYLLLEIDIHDGPRPAVSEVASVEELKPLNVGKPNND